MPSLDGPGMILRLRERGVATPVILMTGRVDSEGLSHTQATDAVTVLAKPFDRTTLLTAIASAVNGQH
jgi:FixJ family two-component response regulator